MPYSWEHAIAYLLLSDDERRILNYARFKRLSLKPELIFIEDAYVGVPFSSRQKAKKLLEAARVSGIQHFIVLNLDRLGRKASDVHDEFVYLTGQLGLTVHVIDLGGDSYSSDNPANKTFTGLLATCARLERNSDRKTFAAQKIKNQEPAGAVSFGWKAFEHEAVKMVVPDTEEQRWLKKIIHWRYVEKWSYGKIALELNRLGIQSKHGRRWNKGTIYKLLQNLYVREFIQSAASPANALTEGTHRVA